MRDGLGEVKEFFPWQYTVNQTIRHGRSRGGEGEREREREREREEHAPKDCALHLSMYLYIVHFIISRTKSGS